MIYDSFCFINFTNISFYMTYRAEEFDHREWNGVLNFKKYNVPSTGKNKSQVQKYKEAATKYLSKLIYL